MTHPHTSRLKMPTLRQRGHFYSIPRSIRNRLEERGNRASQERPGSIEVRDHTSMGTRRKPPPPQRRGRLPQGKALPTGGTPSPPPNASPGKAPGPAAGARAATALPRTPGNRPSPKPHRSVSSGRKGRFFLFPCIKAPPFYLQLYKKVLCLAIIFHPKRSRLTIIGYKGAVT